MKLNVKFDNLWAAVKRITDKRVSIGIDLESTWEEPEYQRIAAELAQGKEVTLEDIGVAGKLLHYKGQHILLYIPDHGRYIESVLDGSSGGNRFHVADCSTLAQMRNQGRFYRYIATTNISGTFHIVGVSNSDRNRALEADVKLQVCQNCIKALNYQNANNPNVGAWKVAQAFNILKFFETYASMFKVLPPRQDARKEMALYTPDWPEVSKKLREFKQWRCEECGVDLSEHHELLHTHHINGVKNDNRFNNLKALCIGCHRRQPLHGHVKLSLSEQKLLNSIKREQHIFDNMTWAHVLWNADPALDGVLTACKDRNWAIPEIEYMVNGRKFDVAWPHKRIAIDISTDVSENYNGWQVLSITDMLNQVNPNRARNASGNTWRSGGRA